MKKVLFIFGTRPEAIKLCPLVRHMKTCAGGCEVRVCITAQHRAMLDQVLTVFDVVPDYDLDLMTPGQTLAGITARILTGVDRVLTSQHFDMVVVQGDTTTCMAGALAAFYRGVPVAHVEAGLRTGNPLQPFPEEINRVVTSRLASLHFAPTGRARRNLLDEGISDDQIFVTGNTGIDAVLEVVSALENGSLRTCHWNWLDARKKLIVVTAHRRESFGAGIERICDALVDLSARGDVQIVYPVHRNPNVLDPVTARVGSCRNIVLLAPLDYIAFVDLMRRSWILMTDSGGIQEEGPSLGKPVLVLRDTTERPEALEAGTVELVGADPQRIVSAVERLLTDSSRYEKMSRVHNPYGDGRASRRIARVLAGFFNRLGSRDRGRGITLDDRPQLEVMESRAAQKV